MHQANGLTDYPTNPNPNPNPNPKLIARRSDALLTVTGFLFFS